MRKEEDRRATLDTKTKEKSTDELLQDACVAELTERFKPVQMALDAM
jgi:hypothetical protein